MLRIFVVFLMLAISACRSAPTEPAAMAELKVSRLVVGADESVVIENGVVSFNHKGKTVGQVGLLIRGEKVELVGLATYNFDEGPAGPRRVFVGSDASERPMVVFRNRTGIDGLQMGEWGVPYGFHWAYFFQGA